MVKHIGKIWLQPAEGGGSRKGSILGMKEMGRYANEARLQAPKLLGGARSSGGF